MALGEKPVLLTALREPLSEQHTSRATPRLGRLLLVGGHGHPIQKQLLLHFDRQCCVGVIVVTATILQGSDWLATARTAVLKGGLEIDAAFRSLNPIPDFTLLFERHARNNEVGEKTNGEL